MKGQYKICRLVYDIKSRIFGAILRYSEFKFVKEGGTEVKTSLFLWGSFLPP
jgi:hypothetical protein